MIKFAKVVKIEDEYVVLDFSNQNKCTDCKSRCSNGFLDFLFPQKWKSKVKVGRKKSDSSDYVILDENDFFQNVKIKDSTIGVKFNDKDMLKMAFVLYGVPVFIALLFLMLFTLLAYHANLNQDLFGLFGLILGFLATIHMNAKLKLSVLRKVQFFN